MGEDLQPRDVRTSSRVSSLCFLFFALFLILSRISFDPNDLSHFALPPQSPAHNWGGAIGAQFSFHLLLLFGEAFWWVPALLISWSLRLNLGGQLRWTHQIWALLILCPITAVILAQNTTQVPAWAPSLGGLYGIHFSNLLTQQVGVGGLYISFSILLCVALYFLEIPDFWELIKSAKPKNIKLKNNKDTEKTVPATPKAKPEPQANPDIRPLTKEKDTEKAQKAFPEPADQSTEQASEEEQPDIRPLPPAPEEATPTPDIPPVPTLKSPPAHDGEYQCPDLTLLQPPIICATDSDDFLEQRARHLEDMFGKFKVGCKVIGMVKGPSITQYEMTIEEGTRVNKVTTLSDNIALTLRATSVRIVAPIPGRNTIGIEVPNHKKEMVNLRSILDTPECQARREQMRLPLVLGEDVVGDPLVEDLAKMPHLLVAGTTGSGKSVCINSIIISLILYNKPEQVRLLMIDPKMVEMSGYEGIPHLMRPVITNMDEAAGVLDWACRTMDDRYAMLTRVKVRDIASYNKLKASKVSELVGGDEAMEKMEFPMPYIVIIVDEFSDLMMVGAKEIESYITRLAQKSRAVGIHVILATQRPSVDVITGLIKTNMPSRIAFQVASKIDSRTILDQNGADKLMGKGDSLFMPPGGSALVRAQGVMVDDQEISNVVEFWKAQGEPQYIETSEITTTAGGNASSAAPSDESEDKSEDFAKAIELVIETGRPSASFIQRQLRVGYNKASRFIELMETMGVVGPPRGSKGREILWTNSELNDWKAKQ